MERLTVTVPEMAQMLGIGRIKAYEPVSYTHLDVYKRQI